MDRKVADGDATARMRALDEESARAEEITLASTLNQPLLPPELQPRRPAPPSLEDLQRLSELIRKSRTTKLDK